MPDLVITVYLRTDTVLYLVFKVHVHAIATVSRTANKDDTLQIAVEYSKGILQQNVSLLTFSEFSLYDI